jgi:nitrile hydratase accessory protein
MTDNRPVVPAVLGVPTDQEGPVFREPWEARVFATAVALHETGIFAWSDWAGALGEEIAGAGAAGDSGIADSYYDHWLVALEKMAAQKVWLTAHSGRSTERLGAELRDGPRTEARLNCGRAISKPYRVA